MNYDDIFESELIRFQDVSSSIRIILASYEMKCSELVKSFQGKTFKDSQMIFNDWSEIISLISMAMYKYEFPINDTLQDLVCHLSREGLASRKYWYDKFNSGLTWPE